MKQFLAAASLAALAAFAPISALADAPRAGVMMTQISAQHRAALLDTYIWYPTGAGGTAMMVGGDPLFLGVAAMRGAGLASGKHPLIVLSHGSGGNAGNLAWLATDLSKAGFIVAAVNHPGTTSGDSHQSETVKIWQRPAGLSALIDALLRHGDLAAHIDRDRIGVMGFSLGGHTALSIAGARVHAATFARYCDENRETFSECAWFKKAGIDLHELDAPMFERSNRDPRIKAAVAFDPAMAQAYVQASLEPMNVAVLVMNFGAPGQIPRGIDSAGFVKRIPDAVYQTIPDAHHFSFLGLCRPNGKEILQAEGEEDPICDDRGGRPRAELHAEIAEKTLAFLKNALK